MFWLLPAALGAAGMLKGSMQHKREQQIEDADRKLAAETARYSPWTGMTPQPIRQAGSEFGTVLGSGLEGAGAGAILGQGLGMGGTAKPSAVGASPDIWQQMQQQKNPGMSLGGANYLGDIERQQALQRRMPTLFGGASRLGDYTGA